jgi:SAM-dependent methyltransferase
MIDPNQVKRYNIIPDYILKGKVFEIGAGGGQNQLVSRHKEFFLSENYWGIDSLRENHSPMRIDRADVFKTNLYGKFDTILAIEVLEHIIFTKWDELITKMVSWLNPGGYLYISVPYNENAHIYTSYSPHVVFGIIENTFLEFLPGSKFFIDSHYNLFRGTKSDLNKMTIKTLLRGLKRFYFRSEFHSYYKYGLRVIWKKKKKGERYG